MEIHCNMFSLTYRKLPSTATICHSEDLYFENKLLTENIKEYKKYIQNINQTPQVIIQHVNRAPVTYIQIYENHYVTLGIFVIREGNKLPLHNHPLMHGVIKVIAGTLKVQSYTVLDNNENTMNKQIKENNYEEIPCYNENLNNSSQDSAYSSQSNESSSSSSSSPTNFCSSSILNYLKTPSIFLAKKQSPRLISYEEDCIYLTPKDNNLHEIHCVNGPAAFLDIIGPPYQPYIKDCSYFQDLGEYCSDDKNIRKLQRIPCPPTFHTDEEIYRGPPIKI